MISPATRPANTSILRSTAGANSRKALLKGVRHTSSRSYTRVIVDLSSEVRYETNLLPADRAKELPPRLYIDLFGARLGVNAARPIAIRDGLLQRVRVGQFRPDVVRVVLEMKSLSEHKAFLLADPYRLIVDVLGQKDGEQVASLGKKEKPSRLPGKTAPGTIRKIVLDPGHGGEDPGAIGVGGIAEKDIVLSIATKLARKLRKEMGIEVVLTRQDDSFVPLEDRTAMANAESADLFISIHTNSSPDPRAAGVETYYLDNTNDEASIRLAARENGTSRRSITDLQFILSDLTQNLKLEDSITLAHRLHSSVVTHMSRRHSEVRDLGVKKALFYVLVGARMPAVLVELFFITNHSEGRSLARKAYQDSVVEALYLGIKKYQESTLVVRNL